MGDSVTMTGPLRGQLKLPWILGLYGLAGATFMVAGHMAHWYGGAESAWYLFPFVAFLGGLAQFLAGMWAYQAGDGLATAMLGTWGTFWMAYGALTALFALGKLAEPKGPFVELSFWFIVLAAITWMGAVAATAESAALAAVLVLFAAGSTIAAIAEGVEVEWPTVLAGWVFVIGSVCAWYTATAMLFEHTFGREMLPVGKTSPTTQAAPSVLQQATARRAG